MRRLALALLLLLPLPVAAQDQTAQDRGFLQGLLEDNLSGLGRTIRIEGFAGALSSRATFETLTIADDAGVWLTARGGALSWNRSGLLKGRIDISELSVREIEMPRRPKQDGSGWSEAAGFSLPELPVALNISALRADKVTLGAGILGQDAVLSLSGSAAIEGSTGAASLDATRTDGQAGELKLSGRYDNAARTLALDILADEAEGGIAVSLAGLPGRPAATLALSGAGSYDDVAFDMVLSTAGQRRLSGRFSLLADPANRNLHRFAADLTGDLAPLVLPEYRGFFGDQVTLSFKGQRSPRGRIDLPELRLTAGSIDLAGSAAIASDGRTERAELSVRIGAADGTDVTLPIPGPATLLRRATLTLGYGTSSPTSWAVDGQVAGFRRGPVAATTLRLDGSGRIGRAGQGGASADFIGGSLSVTAGGLSAADPALAAAIGPFLTGKAQFLAQDGQGLKLSNLAVTGRDYAATGNLRIGSLADGLPLSGRIDADLRDLSRFSLLAGRPLSGATQASAEGEVGPLSGTADLRADLTGRDLALGQPEIDRGLAGSSRVTLDLQRDQDGTRLRKVSVVTSALEAQASGSLSADSSDLAGRVSIPRLAVVNPGLGGSIGADFTLSGPDDALVLGLQGAALDLATGIPELDRLLRGQARLTLSQSLPDGIGGLRALHLESGLVTLDAAAAGGGSGALDLTGRLTDLAVLAPAFPGPVGLKGRLTPDADGSAAMQMDIDGPGGLSARLTGRAGGGTADLRLAGTAQAALANPFIRPRTVEGPVSFDLTMRGRASLSAIGGQVTLQGGRIAAPNLRLAVEDLRATATLGGGQAQVDAAGSLAGGGSISVRGPVSLSRPYAADLAIALRNARLRDPNLFETSVSGDLTLTGPVAAGPKLSGGLRLSETEIRIASVGLGGDAILSGITHRADKPAVRETRLRAGLEGEAATASAAAGAARPMSLDLTVNAPARIFVRGRGLDAELGGRVRIGGTSANVQPSGQFDLIRGRLDLLGKRFDIDEGRVSLQGALVPDLYFIASTTTDGVSASVVVQGPATAPRVSFTSASGLPEEEVVARLLFGRDLATLSVLQAAQLASAIATLTGRGGDGPLSRLRSSFGLDDLDVQSGEDGSIGLRAGKYIARNLYTDVTLDDEGQTEIRLNLDVPPGVTLRGRLDSQGQTGIGVWFERDY